MNDIDWWTLGLLLGFVVVIGVVLLLHQIKVTVNTNVPGFGRHVVYFLR